MSTDNAIDWTPPPRPEWLARVNEEGRGMDIASVVPLRPRELIETAIANTGLTDFGDDDWREPFEILVESIEKEAELHLFGRLPAALAQQVQDGAAARGVVGYVRIHLNENSAAAPGVVL